MKFSRMFARTLVIPFAFSSLSIAVAQDAQEEPLNVIVVTGTYGPKTVGESLSSVTVIEEEDRLSPTVLGP